MYPELQKQFELAARALTSKKVKDTGTTENNLRKLDFTVEGKAFTAIEQQPKSGHQRVEIVQCVGTYDATDKKWNDYEPTSKPINFTEIQDAMEAAAGH